MERLDNVIDFTPVRESDILKISARSTNPREAALLANVYAESYVERNLTRAVPAHVPCANFSSLRARPRNRPSTRPRQHCRPTCTLPDRLA